MSAADEDLVLVRVPPPNTNEMVKFLAKQMDQLFGVLREAIQFSAGDVMSACLCHIIEAGQIGRDGDMEGLRQDVLQSVEAAIAHYSAPDQEKRH